MTAGEYARFKRFAEATAIDPDFRQRAARDPAEAARSLSLALSDPESAWEAAAAVNTGSAAEAGDNPYAAEYLRRAAVVGSYVDEMHSREAYRSQEIFLYADAVRNRCRMENSVLRGHSNIRYFPLCFELSLGRAGRRTLERGLSLYGRERPALAGDPVRLSRDSRPHRRDGGMLSRYRAAGQSRL